MLSTNQSIRASFWILGYFADDNIFTWREKLKDQNQK